MLTKINTFLTQLNQDLAEHQEQQKYTLAKLKKDSNSTVTTEVDRYKQQLADTIARTNSLK